MSSSYSSNMPPKPRTRQTLDQLRQTAKTFADIATRLSVAVETASIDNFDELLVTNFDQAQRAIEYANNYAAAVTSCLLTAKQDRGDYGVKANGGKGSSVSSESRKTRSEKSTKVTRSGHKRKTKDTPE